MIVGTTGPAPGRTRVSLEYLVITAVERGDISAGLRFHVGKLEVPLVECGLSLSEKEREFLFLHSGIRPLLDRRIGRLGLDNNNRRA